MKKIITTLLSKKSFLAAIFSAISIGILSTLTFNTPYGIFLLASFGATVVLLFGYPESPFAQPKNIFFGHIATTLIGLIFLKIGIFPEYLSIPLAVGVGVGVMMAMKITHPPAGGNPIIVISGGASFDFLVFPVILGTLIIIGSGIIFNRYIAKINYPHLKN